MLRYFDAVARVVARHGGTIEKFIGDAAMAVFGAPVALEDHALRAVRAAQELEQELTEVNDELRSQWGVQIAVRTGINSGDVVAGDAAAGHALVTGDAVNVAARLQQAAAAGGDPDRGPHAPPRAGRVEAEPLEPLAVRGKAEPLRVWRLGAAARRHAWHGRCSAARPRRGAESPARDVRARRLRAGAATRAGARAGRHREVTTRAGARGGTAGQGDRPDRALPALRRGNHVLGTGRDRAPARRRGRPARGADAALPEAPRAELVADRVLQAAGLEEVTSAREDLTRAVTELFESLARRRPLVLVFEDVHWAEPPLLDLVEHLLSARRDAPLMLLCLSPRGPARAAARMARRHPRRARSSSAAVGRRHSRPDPRAAPRRRGRRSDSARSWPSARRATRCSPSRLVALLREGGEVSLPPTIQALLAARLDRLAPAERAAVGAASVVGREFWGDAVATLLPDQAAGGVEELLASLARKRLVMAADSTLESEAGYSFTHALVRDAAYEALTKQDRAELHERVADWFERRHPERMIELEAIVGYHLESAYRYHADLGPVGPRGYALAQRAARRLCRGRWARGARARGCRRRRPAGARRRPAAGDRARAPGADAADRGGARGQRAARDAPRRSTSRRSRRPARGATGASRRTHACGGAVCGS